MNITAIIVEYNPFHNGHIYHIKNTRRITNCQAVIAIMSGNFVQRGIPSLIDKWNKTKIALLNGVDLVLELPVVYSVSSAEFFSHGAISLMNNLKVVNNICFGSECDNIDLLSSISNILYLEPQEFKNYLKMELLKGVSYAEARSNSIINFFNHNKNMNLKISSEELKTLISSSNNILAIEYLKTLKKLKSSIKPFSIKRQGENYNSIKIRNNFSSASGIRHFLKSSEDIHKLKESIPDETYNIINEFKNCNYNFSPEDLMVPYLKYKYFFNRESMLSLPDISEGIENRIYRAIENNNTYNSIVKASKTKRYAYSRISRILCQFFLGFENWNTSRLRNEHCPYARVLGFNKTGIKVLKEIKYNSSIPVYTKLPKKSDDIDDILDMDIASTRAYSLLNKSIGFNFDYIKSPIILQENSFKNI